MKKFYESTTAQFAIFVLSIAALAAGFTDQLTWTAWLDSAMVALGIYASKEGVRYSAEAYQNKGAE